MKIPVFYIRYPWYIIMKYTTEKIADWESKKGDDKASRLSKSKIIISRKNPIIIFSDDEIGFNNELGLKYDTAYSIAWGLAGKVCVWIITEWNKVAPAHVLNLYEAASHGKQVTSRTSLQESVYSPLAQFDIPIESSKTITVQTALYLCELASFVVNGGEENQIIIKIKSYIEEFTKNNIDSSISSITKNRSIKFSFEDFLNKTNRSKLPKIFDNTRWISYERTDPDNTPNATWGIASSIIQIGNYKNDITPIFFQSRYGEGLYECAGHVYYNLSSGYLIASLLRHANENNKVLETPCFFVMRVRDPQHQTLMLGHYINYSLYFEKFITKSVIWKKDDNNILQESPQDLVNASEGFKKIDINIRRYLYSRQLNRLSLPHTGISNLNNKNDQDRSLSKWLNKHIADVISDKKLRACVDKYYVCYLSLDYNVVLKSDNEIRGQLITKHLHLDNFEIRYEDDGVEFTSQYTHYIMDGEKSIENIYIGKVSRNHTTIQTYVEFERFVSKPGRMIRTSNNAILLSFTVPPCNADQAKTVFNECNYFEGIISGLNDPDNKPISLRCLVVKRKINSGDSLDIDINSDSDLLRNIKSYFLNNFDNLSLTIR